MSSSNVEPSIDLARITDAMIAALADMNKMVADWISADTRLFDDLALESMSILELLLKLEDDLGFEFDPETLEPSDFDTVGSLAAYAARQFESQP
jgi:acyl carrier protein